MLFFYTSFWFRCLIFFTVHIPFFYSNISRFITRPNFLLLSQKELLIISTISALLNLNWVAYIWRRTTLICFFENPLQCCYQFAIIKINDSRYIALFMVSRCIKKLSSIDCVNIYFSKSIANYLFSILFQ